MEEELRPSHFGSKNRCFEARIVMLKMIVSECLLRKCSVIDETAEIFKNVGIIGELRVFASVWSFAALTLVIK